MSNAAALRLRDALNDYVRSISGDTGTRRGSVRGAVNERDRKLVEQAQGLLAGLEGGGDTSPAGRNTPGSRARQRAETPGSRPQEANGWGRDAARALLGTPPADTGTPTPTQNGGASQ